MLAELKKKLNHVDNDAGKNHTVSHVIVQVPYIDMTHNNDIDM